MQTTKAPPAAVLDDGVNTFVQVPLLWLATILGRDVRLNIFEQP